MKRGISFRIVGFAFLAFAALTIYQGEFQLGRSGGVTISRAHDPDVFWRYVIVQVGIGFALLYLSRRARTGPSLLSPPSAPQSAAELVKLPNFDPVFCGKIVKGAACVCVGLIVAELLVLLLVHPSDDRCPGWIFHPHQPSAVSTWVLVGIALLAALWMSYVALTWDGSYAQTMHDRIISSGSFLIEFNWLMLMVVTVWCVFCAIPLLVMLGQCTALYHYLNAFHV